MESFVRMENIYHQLYRLPLYCEVEPLATQIEHVKPSPSEIPFEIDFELSVNKVFYRVNPSDGKLIGPIDQSRELVTREKCTIQDIRCLETQTADVTRSISDVFSLLDIAGDMWEEFVNKILDRGRQIGDSDSNNGAKVLRMKVDLQWVVYLIRCDECTKAECEKDELIMKTLERVGVVSCEDDDDGEKESDDNDSDNVEEKEKEKEKEKVDEGRKCKRKRVVEDGVEDRKSKRRHVVCESEICPICMEKFVVGSDYVTSMPCLHVFHDKCIGRWLKGHHHNCPMCRSEMPIVLGSQARQSCLFSANHFYFISICLQLFKLTNSGDY